MKIVLFTILCTTLLVNFTLASHLPSLPRGNEEGLGHSSVLNSDENENDDDKMTVQTEMSERNLQNEVQDEEPFLEPSLTTTNPIDALKDVWEIITNATVDYYEKFRNFEKELKTKEDIREQTEKINHTMNLLQELVENAGINYLEKFAQTDKHLESKGKQLEEQNGKINSLSTELNALNNLARTLGNKLDNLWNITVLNARNFNRSLILTGCPEGKFRCERSTKCISAEDMCNGISDCPNSEDETDCKVCQGEAFHCKSTPKCIHKDHRCDTDEDCPDGEDERNCKTCKNGFLCNRSSPMNCIPLSARKNGRHNCLWGEDEY